MSLFIEIPIKLIQLLYKLQCLLNTENSLPLELFLASCEFQHMASKLALLFVKLKIVIIIFSREKQILSSFFHPLSCFAMPPIIIHNYSKL